MTETPTTRNKRKACCLGCGGLLLIPVLLFVIALIPTWHTQNTPISVEEAREHGCPIPLPDSAHNVQFYQSHFWIDYSCYVRFEADPAVCRAHVKTVIEDNLKGWKENEWHPPSQTDLVPISSPRKEGGIPWFNVQDIKHGSMRRGVISYDPDIWIDEDRGIFYYRNTD